MHKTGIYQIRNLTTGKFYIGSATNISKRFSQHKDALRKNSHDNKYLQNAWNKYGENDFVFEILQLTNKVDLLKIEQVWFDWSDCCNRDRGYNINSNASSNLGFKFSEEAKRNMSNGQKRNLNKDRLIKISSIGADKLRGVSVPEERKLKISKALTGRKLNKTHVAKVSMSNREYARRKQAANVIGILSMGC